MRINIPIIYIFCLLILVSCKKEYKELPVSYYDFPIDTTVQILLTFPTKLEENSGLVIYRGSIWTHNDSGDDPNIYEVSLSSGDILRTILLENATARDWEDIDQDEQFMYISDLGNNAGKRRDLAIFKIPKAEINDGKNRVRAEKINIQYPDRKNFKPKAYKHNFDCEAMLSDSDSLYLFSKNHLDQHCRLYSLSKDNFNQIAILKDRFDTKGMITGASADFQNGVLALVGYNLNPAIEHFGPFVWFFWDYPANNFFKGKSKRINLPFITQTEGIAFWENGKFIISSEESRIMGPKAMVIDAKKWVDEYQTD